MIHEDGHIESELAEPYDILLNPRLRARAQAATHLGTVATAQEQARQADWATWEVSLNDSAHKEKHPVGAGEPCQPRGRPGSNNEILVGERGLEPPCPYGH